MGMVSNVSHDTISSDHKSALRGKLPEDMVEKIASSVKQQLSATGYAANGSVASLIFYQTWQVQISNGKTFNGKSGGIASPGGGALFGTVYTSDINSLYNNTVSFEFNVLPVYTNVLFFDGNSNVLGTFQAGSVSTVSGTGGGSGSWS